MSLFVITSNVKSHEGIHQEAVAACTSLECAVEYIMTTYVAEDYYYDKVKEELFNNNFYTNTIDNVEFTYRIEKVSVYKMKSGYIEPL